MLWNNQVWDVTPARDLNNNLLDNNVADRIPITVDVVYRAEPQAKVFIAAWHAPSPVNPSSITIVARSFCRIVGDTSRVMAWMGEFNTPRVTGFEPFVLLGPLGDDGKTTINDQGQLVQPYDKVMYYRGSLHFDAPQFGYDVGTMGVEAYTYTVYAKKGGRYFIDLVNLPGGNTANFYNISDHLPIYADFVITRERIPL